mmetsp:Transcript_5944/g.13742  ORF Transcript_5944/g.13742 Transcript_5944/m.13742 type:complete len:378 (-) Transcript_5944:231-1364(-)|eukprot:767379-Hanusia_phi.AAC.1
MASPNSRLSQREEALQALKGATAPPVWPSVKLDMEEYSSQKKDALQHKVPESPVKDESHPETGENPVIAAESSESFYKLLLDLCLQIDHSDIEPFLRERVGKILKICTVQRDPTVASHMFREFELILCGTDFVKRHVMGQKDLDSRMCHLAIVYSILKGCHECMLSNGYEGKTLKGLLVDLAAALEGKDSNSLPRLREFADSQNWKTSSTQHGPRELLLQAQEAYRSGDMEQARSLATLCRNNILSMRGVRLDGEAGPDTPNRLHDIWAGSLKILVEAESQSQGEREEKREEKAHSQHGQFQRFSSPGSRASQQDPSKSPKPSQGSNGVYQIQYVKFSPERGRSELLAVWKDLDGASSAGTHSPGGSVKHWLFESCP